MAIRMPAGKQIPKHADGRPFDPSFELGLEIARWFFYRHKARVVTPYPKNRAEVITAFQRAYVSVYGGKVKKVQAYWEMVPVQEAENFMEEYKDLVAETEIVS